MLDKATNQNDLVSEEILQALNFILEGSVDNMQTKLAFSDFLKQPIVQSKIVSLKLIFKSRFKNLHIIDLKFNKKE